MTRDTHHTAAVLGVAVLFAVLTLLFVLGPEETGRVTTATQVQIVNATPVNCTVTASSGYNVVSFPCISSAEPRATTVPDTGVVAMYQYTPSTSDKWRVHNPNLPGWVVSDLEYLTRRAGYVLILSSDQTYLISGTLATTTDVPIIAGWSLVGYPSLDDVNITTGVSSINASITEVRAYYPSDGGYRVYLVASQSGNLTNLTPGYGFWINGSASDTWTVTG